MKFNGWWWEICDIGFTTGGRDGRLTLKPVKKASTGHGKRRRKHFLQQIREDVERERNSDD
jgi:hypothetical protein